MRLMGGVAKGAEVDAAGLVVRLKGRTLLSRDGENGVGGMMGELRMRAPGTAEMNGRRPPNS